MNAYPGIDYAGPCSMVNRDKDTGIRYGIIPVGALNDYALESFEPDYGTPHCPKCGNDVITIPCHTESDPTGAGKWVSVIQDIPVAYEDYETARHECADYACEACEYLFGSESAYGENPIGNTLDNGEYQGNLDDSNDVWIFKSPYYTRAQFCSPCAPGAGYLANPCEAGPKTYCLGHDWFDGGQAPYPVYHVDTGELVPAPENEGTTFSEEDKILNGSQS